MKRRRNPGLAHRSGLHVGISRKCWPKYDLLMTAVTKARMTVDEYLAWAESRPGRYELVNGTVYAMTPERAVHAEIKLAVHMALAAGIRARALACRVMQDGMTVRVDEATAYEPDALVYCGPKLAPSALEVTNPVVVVEVLSPSSPPVDAC